MLKAPHFCLPLDIVEALESSVNLFQSSAGFSHAPCCSMLSLCRGLSLLKETTDSVSVWSSRVSTLPVALGLLQKHTHKKKAVISPSFTATMNYIVTGGCQRFSGRFWPHFPHLRGKLQKFPSSEGSVSKYTEKHAAIYLHKHPWSKVLI